MRPASRASAHGTGDLTLAIDASTVEGSAAIMRGVVVLAERTVAMRGADEERLMPAVASAIAEVGASVRDLARVVCAGGPGSFTSLRIAASIAKGIAMATGAKLYAVSSLELAAVEALNGGKGERGKGGTGERGNGGRGERGKGGTGKRGKRVVVALDAMRGDVFFGVYEWSGDALVQVQPWGLQSRDDANALAASLGATFVDARPHARAAARLMRAVLEAGPVDLATWEPDYGRKAEAQVRWEAAHGKPLAP